MTFISPQHSACIQLIAVIKARCYDDVDKDITYPVPEYLQQPHSWHHSLCAFRYYPRKQSSKRMVVDMTLFAPYLGFTPSFTQKEWDRIFAIAHEFEARHRYRGLTRKSDYRDAPSYKIALVPAPETLEGRNGVEEEDPKGRVTQAMGDLICLSDDGVWRTGLATVKLGTRYGPEYLVPDIDGMTPWKDVVLNGGKLVEVKRKYDKEKDTWTLEKVEEGWWW